MCETGVSGAAGRAEATASRPGHRAQMGLGREGSGEGGRDPGREGSGGGGLGSGGMPVNTVESRERHGDGRLGRTCTSAGSLWATLWKKIPAENFCLIFSARRRSLFPTHLPEHTRVSPFYFAHIGLELGVSEVWCVSRQQDRRCTGDAALHICCGRVGEITLPASSVWKEEGAAGTPV